MKAALEAEERYDLLLKLTLSTDPSSGFIAVETAIPCVLHGGNRLGEKVFMMILIIAWRECTTKSERDELIETFETFVNTGAFGTEESRAQWKLPLDKEGNIDCVSFTAWRVHKILLILSTLAERLFVNDQSSRLADWQRMLSKYTLVLSIAFRYDDFSNEDIEEFQDIVDEWYYLYVELLSVEGVSNYAHLLGAGHLYPYLKKRGNLYRFQQQGWEKKNGFLASFCNRWTRRSGAGGKYGPAHTSRIIPVMQWFQRSSVFSWLSANNNQFSLVIIKEVKLETAFLI